MNYTPKKITLLLCAVCIIAITSCSSPDKDKDAYFNKALEYIEKDQNKAAILELRNAIKIDPKFGDARYQLGLLYLEQGEAKKAYAQLTRAADLAPDNLDASLKVAQLSLMARQKDECQKRLEHILQKEPTHRDALALKANLEVIEGQFDTALESLLKIGEEVETSAELQNIKGRILASQKELAQAEEAFRKAIELDDSNNISHYFMLLQLYEQTKDSDNTKLLIDEMLEKFPENIQAHQLMAGHYRRVGKNELIAMELQKVVDLAPSEAKYRLQLAHFIHQEGDYKREEEVLVTALSDLPENQTIKANLARFYFDQRQFDKSNALLDELTIVKSDNREAKLLAARFLLKDGKIKDAIPLLQELTKNFPNWAEPYFYIALAQQKLGEPELAKLAVSNAIEKNNNISKYHGLLAELYVNKGNFTEARKEATIAVRLNSKNLKTAIILGRSLVGEKEFDHAIKLLSAIKAQVPPNAELLDTLALAFIGAKDLPQAESTLVELLAIDPGHSRALSLYLKLRYKNDLVGAIGFVKQQTVKAPDDFRLYLMLGNLLKQNGQKQEALLSYEEAQKLTPSNPTPYIAAAQLLNSMGKTDQSFVKYKEILEQQPNSLLARMGMAGLYEAKGDSKKAIEQYQAVLQIDENFVPAANNLAYLIASDPDGDLGKALQLAMTAKQAYPEDPNISDTLGWVHYKRKSYSLAVTQFKLAVQAAADNPVIRYHLALAFTGNEQPEKAIKTLEELLRQDIDFPDINKAKKLLSQLQEN